MTDKSTKRFTEASEKYEQALILMAEAFSLFRVIDEEELPETIPGMSNLEYLQKTIDVPDLLEDLANKMK